MNLKLKIQRQAYFVIASISCGNVMIILLTIATTNFKKINYTHKPAFMLAIWSFAAFTLYSILIHYMILTRLKQINQVLK